MVTVFVGEDAQRPLGLRVVKFLPQICENFTIIDTHDYPLEGIDEKYRGRMCYAITVSYTHLKMMVVIGPYGVPQVITYQEPYEYYILSLIHISVVDVHIRFVVKNVQRARHIQVECLRYPVRLRQGLVEQVLVEVRQNRHILRAGARQIGAAAGGPDCSSGPRHPPRQEAA